MKKINYSYIYSYFIYVYMNAGKLFLSEIVNWTQRQENKVFGDVVMLHSTKLLQDKW